MMFSNIGHRPRTQQRIRLGATQDGKLTAIRHDFSRETSQLDDFVEHCGEQTPFLYSCPNLEVTTAHGAPQCGRAGAHARPGRGTGAVSRSSPRWTSWPIKLKMDPVELRLKNDAERDEGKNLAVLVAPPEGVLPDRRGKDRLEAAHARSGFDAA